MKRHSWTQKRLETWPYLVTPIHIFSFSFPGSWALEEWEQQAGAGPFHYTLTNRPGRLAPLARPVPTGYTKERTHPMPDPVKKNQEPLTGELLPATLEDPEAGATTAEYGIVMLAAVGFAGLLVVILKSEEVRQMLLGIVQNALSTGA